MSADTVVLRALGLGDLLTAVPALRALRRAYPEHRQVVTCAPWLTDLAEHLALGDTWITGTLDGQPAAGEGLSGRHELEAAQLHGLVGAGDEPALGVNLRGTRTPLHLAVLRLRPRQYIAFRNPEVPETADCPEWDPAEHEVLSWCRLVRAFDIPADPADLYFQRPGSDRAAVGPRQVLIHPGAGRPARQWPVARWAAVARGLRARGYEVLVSCARHESDRAREITELACAGTVVQFRDADILALADAIADSALLVSADTGVPHLATALRVPSVVLFGPSSPARWGPPPGDREIHVSIWTGRTGNPDADELDPGLAEITADRVLAEVDRLRADDVI